MRRWNDAGRVTLYSDLALLAIAVATILHTLVNKLPYSAFCASGSNNTADGVLKLQPITSMTAEFGHGRSSRLNRHLNDGQRRKALTEAGAAAPCVGISRLDIVLALF